VGRDELAVEQFGAGAAQGRNQPGQRDLGGIGHPAEHAFAAERPIETDSIQSADHGLPAGFIGLPAFDRMRVAELVEPLIACRDAVADPAFAAALLVSSRRGTGLHHIGEGGVARDGEAPAPQRPRQRAREVEAVQRQNRPLARLDPEYLGIVAMIGHREDAAAIGEHQQLGVDDRRRCGSVHGRTLAEVRGLPNLREHHFAGCSETGRVSGPAISGPIIFRGTLPSRSPATRGTPPAGV